MLQKNQKWQTVAAAVVIFSAWLLVACSGITGKKNRLQYASSPYLQEHADNPVDWYEWGQEALDKAKKENKPLLISIGYASCHWCHEMEKESFMDTAVARIMNEKFVCIKVDREERPDIDNIYMNALQLISGNAGWPLNAFALPDGKPFFAGTYYTNKSWKSLLQSISNTYATKNQLVITQANALVNGMVTDEFRLIDTAAAVAKTKKETYAQLFDSIYTQVDLRNGGLKGTQKFPTPALAELLLQHFYVTGEQRALEAARTMLNKMAMGGIYDHIGGGFARYTTDSLWRIPHFEKMLYDNGQLISLYAHAYQLTKDQLYKDVVAETIAFVEKTLLAQGGGYYSSVNADAEEGEGEYYVWKANELKKIVGTDNQLLLEYFNVSEKGNWQQPKNILYINQTASTFAIRKKMLIEDFRKYLANAKAKILSARNERKKPTVDTKIVTAWNAILLKGYADAYAAFGDPVYLQKAMACAGFIERNILGKDGSLKRIYKDGKANIEGFLDDYAWTATAFIRLYEVSLEQKWIDVAKNITQYATNHFLDKKTGLFYYADPQKNDLIMRKTPITDDDLPAANAVMAKVLYTIGTIYNQEDYSNQAIRMVASVEKRVKEFPRYHIQWAAMTGFFAANTYEVVITGKDALVQNMLLQEYYLPTSITMGSTIGEPLPLMQQKQVNGKTLIYVCTNKLCKRPEEELPRAIDQIKPNN
ncbi:thioredoxin domain-containing protein [Sediminibacterium goheungense]|uniref:Spermatogenesis-associated protein 20-like TRX domain-containing protein n=1 Tax=Sediminibacterium goheungense TaxID=1086393 RepID=A0A4R6IUH7_9BACT|nr:thioredoxin domain-containing protein [Sediminibacterium goheungense]TDO26259.1 hypothetical protein BC659_1564 [Sediminibacterium goheungense]